MFSKIPERYLHIIRWMLAVGWLGLIFSMFYDPISAELTQPNHLFGPDSADACVMFQGECQPVIPYAMAARIFWGMIVPLSIMILFVLGHEVWRRICPLSFMSQIPRALGWQRQRVVRENSWLHRHHLLVQFGLLFVGLNIRLLLINSDPLLLGIFLLLVIGSAIAVGFLYDGKTWCNYICPMGPVQMVYSEPSGLLGSQAHTAPPRTITQSMCRTVDRQGHEQSVCVACQSPCIDIDAERSYWDGIHRPDRKVIYYAYLGLVVGFYLYFWLYSGNWNFIAEGVWHETHQLATLLTPGFYASGKAIPIPKLIAVPLTLTLFSVATYGLGLSVEKAYRRYSQRRRLRLSRDQMTHRVFTLTTFLAFNLLFFLGVYPTLTWTPSWIQPLFGWGAVLLSSLWLVKVWLRSSERFIRERDGNLLRRQLSKLAIDFSQFLDGRSLGELNPDELYTLAKITPGFTQQYRLQIYTGILQEVLAQGSENASSSLRMLSALRQELGVNDNEHWAVLEQLRRENPHLFPRQRKISSSDPTRYHSSPKRKIVSSEPTTHRQINPKPSKSMTLPAELTVCRPIDQVKAASMAQQLDNPDSLTSDATIKHPMPKSAPEPDLTIKSPIAQAASAADATVSHPSNSVTPADSPGMQ